MFIQTETERLAKQKKRKSLSQKKAYYSNETKIYEEETDQLRRYTCAIAYTFMCTLDGCLSEDRSRFSEQSANAMRKMVK